MCMGGKTQLKKKKKMSIVSKLIYRFVAILAKIPEDFLWKLAS